MTGSMPHQPWLRSHDDARRLTRFFGDYAMPSQVKPISSGHARSRALSLPVKVLLALVGVGVLAASAHIAIPFWPVPMTMESGTVLLLGAVYGSGLAEATLLAYLAAGALGLPVFAAGGRLRLPRRPDGRLFC